eukprot:tig00021432_g21193.t1
MRVLVTGGSGFVAPFVVERLVPDHEVLVTYNTHPVELPGAQAARIDLADPAEADAARIAAWDPQAVVHLAAIANTVEAEEQPERARAVNVAGTGNLLKLLPNKRALLLNMSTDLVFDGEGPTPYDEGREATPICAYGASKLEAEGLLGREWRGAHASLRSALEYGPAAATTTNRSCFLQFFEQKLAAATAAHRAGQPYEAFTCFADEYRSALMVDEFGAGRPPPHAVYHMGGPENLSRYELALALAAHRGHEVAVLRPVPAKSVSRHPRPPNTELDCSRLLEDYPGFSFTPFRRALAEIF